MLGIIVIISTRGMGIEVGIAKRGYNNTLVV